MTPAEVHQRGTAALADAAEPVIIRGALRSSDWNPLPAASWTWKTLIDAFDESDLASPVWVHNGTERTFAKGDTEGLHDAELAFWARYPLSSDWKRFSQVVSPTRKLLHMLASADQGQPLATRLYYNVLPDKGLKKLADDLLPNSAFFVGQPSDTPRSLWVSSPEVVSHSHMDRNMNFFAQILGTKRFTILSPRQTRLAYPYSVLSQHWSQFQVDFLNWNSSRFPALAQATECYTVDVGPGDVLALPPYWLHHIRSLTSTVSLSHHSYPPYLLAEAKSLSSAYTIPLPIKNTASAAEKAATLRALANALASGIGAPSAAEFYADLYAKRLAPIMGDLAPSNGGTMECGREAAPDPRVAERASQLLAALNVLRPGPRETFTGAFVEEVLHASLGIHDAFAFIRLCLAE